MYSVEKYGNLLDDKKEAVVTTPLSEKKLLTTEKITTSDEVHKRTEKLTTSDDVVKGTDEVQRSTENMTTNKDSEKSSENWKIRKMQWSQSIRRIKRILRVILNYL